MWVSHPGEGAEVSFSYVVDNERFLVRVDFFGGVTYEMLKAATEAALTEHRLQGSYGLLCDFTRVETWKISAPEVRSIAGFHLGWRPVAEISRNAFVAPQDHIFGCLRMWEVMTEDMRFPRRVFREEMAAVRWLECGELPDDGAACFPL